MFISHSQLLNLCAGLLRCRGEKAFCSNECRRDYIDEEIEEVEELMMLDSAGSSALLAW